MYLLIEEKAITDDLKLCLIKSIETGSDENNTPAIKIETETTEVIITIDNELIINTEERSFKELQITVDEYLITGYLDLLRFLKKQ